ncbi:MAG TPA: hypothetical protein PLD27_11180 [bacterium]|nr:hypothetical protein [bacterium]HOL48300.1 hypothetical protein [bacterium]HPQ19800.1 hypothetical protein [bacterium]
MYFLKKEPKKNFVIFITIIIIFLVLFIGKKLLVPTKIKFKKENFILTYDNAIKNLEIDKLDINANKELANFYFISFRKEELILKEIKNKQITKELIEKQLNDWEKYNVIKDMNYYKSKLTSATEGEILKKEYIKIGELIINELVNKALFYYHRCMGIDENELTANDYFNISLLYYYKGLYHYHIAKKYIIKAIEEQYHNPEVYIVLGNIFLEERNFEEALNWYKKAYVLKSDNFIINYNYIKIHFYLKKYDEALKEVNKIIKKYKIKKLIKQKKEIDFSEQIYIKDKYLFTKFLILKFEILLEQQKNEEIKKEITNNQEFIIEDEEYYNFLGKLFEKENDKKKALDSYQKAMLLSSTPEIYTKKIKDLQNKK